MTATQLPLWEIDIRLIERFSGKRATGQLAGFSVEAWIDEARREREQRYEHRVLRGRALRDELQRCRQIGLQHRHRERLRRLARREEEQ